MLKSMRKYGTISSEKEEKIKITRTRERNANVRFAIVAYSSRLKGRDHTCLKEKNYIN